MAFFSMQSLWWLCVFGCALCLTTETVSHPRSKRFLIFPRQAPTRFQFIGGIGIPADLDYESLTVGHVLKAQFYLPYNATVFRENPYWPEYKNDYALNTSDADTTIHVEARRSNLRWDLYEYLENRLNSYGYKGRECVLKAICEANALQFMQHHNIFAELLHIFFSPGSAVDRPTAESIHYLEAERLGRTTGTCDIYACNISLLEWISNVIKIS